MDDFRASAPEQRGPANPNVESIPFEDMKERILKIVKGYNGWVLGKCGAEVKSGLQYDCNFTIMHIQRCKSALWVSQLAGFWLEKQLLPDGNCTSLTILYSDGVVKQLPQCSSPIRSIGTAGRSSCTGRSFIVGCPVLKVDWLCCLSILDGFSCMIPIHVAYMLTNAVEGRRFLNIEYMQLLLWIKAFCS